MNDMVKVWIRTLGTSCRIRVENENDATWLLERLSREKSLADLDLIKIEQTQSGYMFQIPDSLQSKLANLEVLLTEWPEVQLMLEPESS